MADEAHEETEALLADMERKIRREYIRAAVELQEKMEIFMQEYESERVGMMMRAEAGDITEKQLQKWNHDYVMKSQWYGSMIETLSQDLVSTDRKAASIVNDHTPEAYAVNYNFGTYQVESSGMVDTSFTLYDRHTVERLLRDEPDLLPIASVDEGKDLRWNRQKVSSSILQSVLQGESMTDAAKRLQGVVDMDFRSAMRSARTAITGAQNAGRIGSYRRAQDMGIEMRQEWLATLDQRTRHSHRRLDGERVEVGEKFSNGLKYPGDPDGGRGSEIYNCRCTLVPVVEGVDQSDAPRNSKLGKMTYEEWKTAGNRRTKEEPTSEHNVVNMVEPKYGKFRGLSYVDDGLEKHWGDGSDLDPRRMVMEDTGFDAERAEQVRMDVSSWVGQGYKKIRLEEGEYALTADRLDEFIKVSPKYEGAVWRGIGVEREVADEILNTLRGGGSIDNRGIASWATESDWATEFMSMHSEELDDPVGIIFQLDENRSGASIKHIADIDNDEVIAPRGVEYELVGEIETVVDPYDGEYLLVHVREVA